MIDSLDNIYEEVQSTLRQSPDRKTIIQRIHQNQQTKQNQYWENLSATYFIDINSKFLAEMKNLQLKIRQRDEEGMMRVAKLKAIFEEVAKLTF